MSKQQNKNVKNAANELTKSIMPLAREIEALRSVMRSQGLFADDRELGACLDCQLFEDVAYSGRLYVYRNENFNVDTGLKFEEQGDNALKCPGCGKVFCPYDSEAAKWLHDKEQEK